jgi:phosphate transport system substrate-binding protein
MLVERYIDRCCLIPFYILLIAVYAGCTGAPSSEENTILTGKVSILVDETFEPIAEDQVTVFQSSYKHTEIDLISKPENNVVADLLNGKAEIAILARLLSEEEMKPFEARKFRPRITKFAVDGIALVTHKSNPDSLAEAEDILNLLRGNPGRMKSLVFDHANSSTVRFLKEKAGVDKLPESGVYALRSNADVLRYVAENKRSVGVIGINWIVQPDPELVQYVEELKVMGVKNVDGKPGSDAYYKPSQSSLALGLYPFSRGLYVINCEPRNGLGIGFASFVAGERGQKIVLKSGLLPDSIPPREIIIRNLDRLK